MLNDINPDPRLRYAIHNCRSIDADNYMLARNVENNTQGSFEDGIIWLGAEGGGSQFQPFLDDTLSFHWLVVWVNRYFGSNELR